MNSGVAARLESGRDDDMALVFIVDMNTPGLKLISRPSFEAAAKSPFDAPLASRFDENDAVVVFDRAFVPWENVLIYRDVERAKSFYAGSGFFNRFNLQANVRLAIKLEFCAGLLLKSTAATGTQPFRGVQAAIGEIIAMRDLVWALSTAMVYEPERGAGDSVLPSLHTAAANRLYQTNAWDRVREIFETILAAAHVHHLERRRPSQYRVGPHDRPVLQRHWDRCGRAHQVIQVGLGCTLFRVCRPSRLVRKKLRRKSGAATLGCTTVGRDTR